MELSRTITGCSLIKESARPARVGVPRGCACHKDACACADCAFIRVRSGVRLCRVPVTGRAICE